MIKRALSSLLIGLMVISMVACNNNSGSKKSTVANQGKTTAENGGNQENTSSSSLQDIMADPEQVYGTTFGQGTTIDVDIDISADDWKDLLKNATAEEYHPANVTVNGTTVQNAGIRTKGFSSLASVANSDSDRYGFKLKFDEYVDGQTLNGLDTLVLNSSFSDPSYMREFLTYSAMEYIEGLTPYLSYCHLYVNGELYGLYLCIESYDDSFVERNTDSADTVLYKAISENCTLLPGDDASGFDVDYGKDDDFSNIKELIQILNTTTEDNKEQLESILDIDSVLKAFAVNTVMGNYDSYNGSKAHNYYLLYSNGKFSYLGWDYNMSLGGFLEDGGASVTVDVAAPVYNVELSQRPLIQKLLVIEDYKERYLGYIDSLSNYFADFEGIVGEIADQIHNDVENDPTAFYTINQFETSITASDTDLTKVQSRVGKMGRPDGNLPEGMPDAYGYFLPDKSAQQDMPGKNRQRPDSNGYSDSDSLPMPPSDSNHLSGYWPDMPYGNKYMPGGMGNMISQDTVSIVDYFIQRQAQIKAQK